MDTYNAVLTNTANNFRDWTEYFSFNVCKKKLIQIFIPEFFQWTRRMQFSQLGQINFDESRTSLRLLNEYI